MERLSHPNIVQVFDLTEAPLGFTMEFADGPNLAPVLGELGTLGSRLKIFKLVAPAVDYAHQVGVLHRDIKPENVLVEYNEGVIRRVLLTDFDLAWFSTALTSVASQGGIGTIWYAAPEQLTNPDANRSRNPAVDVYSLGQLMFFMMCGRAPASAQASVNRSALEGALQRDFPSRAGAAQVIDLYVQSTQLRQEDRLQSVEELLDRLDNIILNFVDTDDDYPIDSLEFFEEIARILIGSIGTIENFGEQGCSTKSSSGKVHMSARLENRGRNVVKVLLAFRPANNLLVDGTSTYVDARLAINKRLDNKIARLTLPHGLTVERKAGHDPSFSTTIEIDGVGRTRSGSRTVGEVGDSISALLDQYFS